jgi:tetratricopeptide (TPR) repeat protein
VGGPSLQSFCRWLFWPSVLGLVALNVWWYVEARPLPELKTLSAWIDAGRTAEAEETLRTWLKRSPNYGEARVMLARMLAARNDLRGCAEQLRAVPYWSQLKTEALFREGQTWLSIDRARDAEQAFRRYIADDPNHPVSKPYQAHAEVELINLLTVENRWEEVRAVIRSALPRTEGVAREELLVMSLRTFLERWIPKAAYKTLNRYVAADSSDLDARLALALNAQLLGRSDESDAQIAVCLQGRPADLNVWRTWLDLLKERGDLQALRTTLDKAPEVVSPVLWPYRGQVLAQDGKLQAAFEAYSKAITARPNDADLYYSYALIARRLGKAKEEEQALKKLKVMRKAREELPDALEDYVKLRDEAGTTPEQRSASCARLSKVCKELGWEFDATEWAKLAADSRPQ